ncbi:MAG: hypothetical protein V3T77_05170, partial [Planctomycetota bacterium]
MKRRTRREFLGDVGRGMLIAGMGPTLASELGILLAHDDSDPSALTFGPLEPLVSAMQGTPVEQLQPLLARKLRHGTDLKTLVAAGALANARSFGGEDYVGYHALMALMPAYEMSQQLPAAKRALPVFKVLYRNTARIQASGMGKRPTLRPVDSNTIPKGTVTAEQLLQQVRKRDLAASEGSFARIAQGKPIQAYNALQPLIQDDIEVHRVVLAWRAWDLLKLTGYEHAHTMLRQAVHFCVQGKTRDPKVRKVLPRLLDEYKLLSRAPGQREAEDRWIEELAYQVFASSRERAAEAVAASLAEGFSAHSVGEALSLASTLLLLHDPGRRRSAPGRPVGSVHGASVGVHASDSAHAWRHIAQVSDHRNAVASLIVGAYHTAGQKHHVRDEPFPYMEQLPEVQKNTDGKTLLKKLEGAIQSNDQAQACVLVHQYGTLRQPPEPLFALLLRFAVSEDGALHAEKYYRTVNQEFPTT